MGRESERERVREREREREGGGVGWGRERGGVAGIQRGREKCVWGGSRGRGR